MKPIWAVARGLIIEVLRMRLLMAFVIILLAVMTFGMALWLHFTPGQADREVQTFLSYSFSFTWTTLSLLTIFVSIATITRDIKRREVFTIMTKPLSRGQFLLGKFLGLALFNLVAVLIIGFTIYGLARVLQRTEPTTQAERGKLEHLVFIARRGIPAPLPDVSARVKEKVESIVADQLASNPAYRDDPVYLKETREILTKDFTESYLLNSQTVPIGHTITWHFTDVKPKDKQNGLLFIRFQQDASVLEPGHVLHNEWVFGPEDPALIGGTLHRTSNVIDVMHEFPIPASAISDQGDLYLTFRNSPVNRSRATVVFPVSDKRLELLYAVGGFEANFVRTIGLIYLRLLMLGSVGLAVGAWLSFPVAVLVALVLYVIGLATAFILYAIDWDTPEAHATTIRFALNFLPNYSAYDPVGYIEKGRVIELVSWVLTSAIFWKDVALTLIIVFLGYLIFRFRELARVIV